MKADLEKIEWLRIEKGLSKTEFAREARLSKATIYRLKKDVNCRADTVGKIAKALSVSARELFLQS